jgi:hypothetical protein
MVTSASGINIPIGQTYRAPGPYDEDYRSIARREQLAQILQQQALQPIEAGSYQGIQAPISPLQGIAKVLQGYLAGQQSDEADQARQMLALKAENNKRALSNLEPIEMPQKMARALSQTNPSNDGQIANSNYGEGMPPVAQPQEPVAQAMPVSPVSGTQPLTAGQAPQTGQVAPQRTQMPMLFSDPKVNAQFINIMGEQEYAKQLAKTLEPTTDMKHIASIYGVNSPEYKAEMQKIVFKGGYVPGQIVTEGGALVPAGANTPSYIAPYRGIQQQVGANNQVTSSVIPGYAESAQAIKQAEALGTGTAKAMTTPATRIDEPTGNVVATTEAANMGLPTQAGGQPQSTKPVVTGINPIVTKAGEQLNQQWITNQLEPAQLAGTAAKNAIDNIRVLKNIDLTTGFGTEAQKNAANVLASFGIKDAAKFATNAQIFESKVYESLVDTLSKQKGPQTDKDFTNIQKTYAQLQNTPQANQFLLDVAEAKAMEDKRKSDYFQDAAAMPQVRGNLSSITNAWKRHTEKDSLFDVPLTDKTGRQYTLSQKYGIK